MDDKKLYFATIKTGNGYYPFCEKETRTGLCDADHEHVYHVVDGDPSELDPDGQRLLASRYSRQQGEELYDNTDNPNHPDNKFGPDHMAKVTPIWDAKSVRGRQWPPA
jgi:hypothetical protein